MASVVDLIPQAQQVGQRPVNIGNWFAKFVAPVPILLTDPAWVVIPDIDLEAKWGPVKWAPVVTETVFTPNIGDHAIVAFDNRRNLWVLTWGPGA